MKKLAFIGILGALLTAGSAQAADEKKAAEPVTQDAPAAAQKKNPVIEAAADFTKDFSDVEKRHFGVLYGNYNLVKVVETVQKDVGLAANKCGDTNPDMKAALDKRYEEWNAAIKPVMGEAEGNINNMIYAQDYAKPKEIKKFFKFIDKTRADRDKEVEKIPVTSKEACEHLLKTMDSTQASMIQLLQATLISLPQIIQEQDAAEQKRQEEEAADKAKEEAAPESAPESSEKSEKK
ncbi:MAG: hypothetical protein IT559_04710 [Alphaproteobacteria bacterium]|nr:hypothetical protein [Alphaproteobacteria bacterium]